MKKLNLDETWKLCLEMWKWVVKQRRLGRKGSVDELKDEWCGINNYEELLLDCFFCERTAFRGSRRCRLCPARRIEKDFSCTNEAGIHYFHSPKKFYTNLLRLNKIRLAKKQ